MFRVCFCNLCVLEYGEVLNLNFMYYFDGLLDFGNCLCVYRQIIGDRVVSFSGIGRFLVLFLECDIDQQSFFMFKMIVIVLVECLYFRQEEEKERGLEKQVK